MPPRNGKSQSGSKPRPNFQDFTFASYTLSKSEKDSFNKWWETHSADVGIYLSEIVNSGYKQSASWDNANDCYIVSFTCLDERSQNYCVILSSRSDDLIEAIGLNIYKHVVLFAESGYPVKTSNSWG